MPLFTAAMLAELLSITDRQARNLLKTVSTRKLGSAYDITPADLKRLRLRNTKRGRVRRGTHNCATCKQSIARGRLAWRLASRRGVRVMTPATNTTPARRVLCRDCATAAALAPKG